MDFVGERAHAPGCVHERDRERERSNACMSVPVCMCVVSVCKCRCARVCLCQYIYVVVKVPVCIIIMMIIIIIIIIKIIAFKCAILGFLQSPHSTSNCLLHVHSSGPGATVCKSRATHQALITCKCHITCHLVRRDTSAIKFDRVEFAFI